MYEIITILNPNVTSEFVETKISDWSKLITEYGAELRRVDRWGKKNLAYEVKKFNQGYFLLFHIKGAHDIIDELERRFKIADEVIRFQTVKLNDREYQNSVELLDQMNARVREDAERYSDVEKRRLDADDQDDETDDDRMDNDTPDDDEFESDDSGDSEEPEADSESREEAEDNVDK
ncbi:MAG TPA: 30S ribosomal protein S6 [bacterium]|nr:30S ribosomal protein S6 [bacterium]